MSADDVLTQCGAVFIAAVVTFENGQYTGSNTLVQGYSVSMVGFDAGNSAFRAAATIIDKAQAAATADAVKKAQQQKPIF
jgi:hypothetical protein